MADGPKERRWSGDGPQGRCEVPSPRRPPMLFVQDANQGGLLIVVSERRGRPLPPEARQAVREARAVLEAASDLPELAWIDGGKIAPIGSIDDGWLRHQASQHPVVRV
jgi:hypothetical protein